VVIGVGTVIGRGAIVKQGVVIYHQVTIGIKGSGKNDGFATIGRNSVLGAGCKILGKLTIGDNCIVGANSVITKDIPSNSVVTIKNKLEIRERRYEKSINS
jgi:serine O-acetyltransferase